MERIKASVSENRPSGGDIKEETIVSKILKTLLPIYEIRVFSIQEMRCDPNIKLNLDALVGRLRDFEHSSDPNQGFSRL